jgi:DNA replication protein DnaC
MRFFNGPSVLVVDELGYLPMPAEDANALFQVISSRYLRGSIILTILTTNRGVAARGDSFADGPHLVRTWHLAHNPVKIAGLVE